MRKISRIIFVIFYITVFLILNARIVRCTTWWTVSFQEHAIKRKHWSKNLTSSKNFKPNQYTYAKKRKLNEPHLCGIKDINDTNLHNEQLLSKESHL